MALDVEWSSRAKRSIKKVPANDHDLIVGAVNRWAKTGVGTLAFSARARIESGGYGYGTGEWHLR